MNKNHFIITCQSISLIFSFFFAFSLPSHWKSQKEIERKITFEALITSSIWLFPFLNSVFFRLSSLLLFDRHYFQCVLFFNFLFFIFLFKLKISFFFLFSSIDLLWNFSRTTKIGKHFKLNKIFFSYFFIIIPLLFTAKKGELRLSKLVIVTEILEKFLSLSSTTTIKTR